MTIWDILLIGVGLSMDAFAVSMCQGLCMERVKPGHALLIALFFGGFQALMPFGGFALGSTFSRLVTIGPWIACGVLVILGGKMAVDGIRDADKEDDLSLASIGKLFLLAIATSIDAFAVGISFSMSGDVVWAGAGTNIFFAVALIGVTTFVLSFIGVLLGNRFGLKYKRRATVFGGVILILIGIKIVLEAYGIWESLFSCRF